jgi:hypothetical protein
LSLLQPNLYLFAELKSHRFIHKIMDAAFSMRAYWWTQRKLFPIPSFFPEFPAFRPDCPPICVLKSVVKEGLRLPPSSEVFITTQDNRTVLPDDISLAQLTSGTYGTVSAAKPLRTIPGISITPPIEFRISTTTPIEFHLSRLLVRSSIQSFSSSARIFR